MYSIFKVFFTVSLFVTFKALFVQTSDFEVIYEWSVVNLTWANAKSYKEAIKTKYYVPQNNFLTGMKIYKDTMYFNIVDKYGGVPVTLVSMSLKDSKKKNQLLEPFPYWKLNDKDKCSNILNVLSFEIDTNGVMWVVDGVRMSPETKNCPAKIVFLDLKDNGKVIHTYNLPNHIALQEGAFITHMVVDETDKGRFGYITDSSPIDPGLIIYSHEKDKAWKIRDGTMFAELDAANVTVEGSKITMLIPIDGIALSPKPKSQNEFRTVYYTPFIGYSKYSISTKILRDEETCKSDTWRQSVTFLGKTSEPNNDLAIDSKARTYATLYSANGIGFWDTKKPFNTNKVIYTNKELMKFPDSLAFDNDESLYVLSNNLQKLFGPPSDLKLDSNIKFRIFKKNIGAKSYFHNDL